MAGMGLNFGLEKNSTCFKRKFRWLFFVPGISAEGTNALPPVKSARPGLNFREIEIPGLNETVYRPGRPDWKPVNLVLYDLASSNNVVFEWLSRIYDPNQGSWTPSGDTDFYVNARLELYNGCGDIIERWRFDNAWPQSIEFGELDMASSEYVTAEIALRYDRAYTESF